MFPFLHMDKAIITRDVAIRTIFFTPFSDVGGYTRHHPSVEIYWEAVQKIYMVGRGEGG